MTSILIIYTGGTIGMVESADRKTLVPFDLAHVLEQVPELKKLNAQLDSVSFETPIDSSDMQPENWSRMAHIIHDNYDSHDGFVILHGSDTLAYTASALSFMLDGLKKPVILTGSQLPIGMIRTDARENLITAVEIATLQTNGEPTVQEVAIYFEYKLYRGNRTKKISTDAFEAFSSPNYHVLAEAGVHINFNHAALFRSNAEKLSLTDGFDNSVSTLFLFPGISETHVETALNTPNVRAVIMVTFGAGNASQQPWFLSQIEAAIARGIIIINMTQCAKGHVEQGKYQTSAALLKLGVISGGDMTFEAAVSKLMLLLAQHHDNAWVIDHFVTNLRGELSVD
ncbi:MAG: asparaginase [Salibacteraceae bacterium]|nr:asparaginase [Salibacteraceae bacterium]MDP4685367.1 asparaginase [Salibacteraceae bacterium]MDP4965605.1 asparaginase [Salibacteraceae bacterium]